MAVASSLLWGYFITHLVIRSPGGLSSPLRKKRFHYQAIWLSYSVYTNLGVVPTLATVHHRRPPYATVYTMPYHS